MTAKRQRVDWDALKPHYCAGVRPLRDIAEEFGCSDAAIVKHAAKMGWERNLKAKIQEQADRKVAAALVAQERADSPAAKLTEAVRVEVESEVQARVRVSHRTDINRSKRMVNEAMAYLEALGLPAVPQPKGDESRKQSARALGLQTLREHTQVLDKLVGMQRTLVSLEREAYGITQLQEDPDDPRSALDPIEGAKRLAFILARAGAAKGK